MKTFLTVIAVGLIGLGGGAAGAETATVAEPGIKGLTRVPFRADNRSQGPIECEAAVAHWYSAKIGSAEAGGSVTGALWSSPETGAVFLLNDKQERMPVQSLWCGIRGRAATTRADVYLERRQGVAEPAVRIACAGLTPEGALACRREAGN
jgi:hypothetical protein